ncbi:hypothetical protein NQ317_019815 [Molorchus minor]|uniref:Uncharacterized protein n=1 Tax=Molorchus minor TaxID=1323400 RepID=A0ABQ9J8H5_9CUCU|nr:hypothetical protein NQ317_019815 [Molorchus minor]
MLVFKFYLKSPSFDTDQPTQYNVKTKFFNKKVTNQGMSFVQMFDKFSTTAKHLMKMTVLWVRFSACASSCKEKNATIELDCVLSYSTEYLELDPLHCGTGTQNMVHRLIFQAQVTFNLFYKANLVHVIFETTVVRYFMNVFGWSIPGKLCQDRRISPSDRFKTTILAVLNSDNK